MGNDTICAIQVVKELKPPYIKSEARFTVITNATDYSFFKSGQKRFKKKEYEQIMKEILGELEQEYKMLEDYVLSKFERSLSGSKCKLVRNYVSIDHPSATIMNPKGYPHCIIEVVEKNLHDDQWAIVEKKVNDKVNNAKAEFAVITDGNNYNFYKRSKCNETCDKYDVTYDEFIRAVKEVDKTELIKDYIEHDFTYFKNCAFSIDGENGNVFLKNQDEEYDRIQKLFKFEDFNGTVYRYTSLKSVFEMLKCGKIRMSGLAGMNDKSETDYIEKILYGSARANSEVNNIFILSCSVNKNDDLTQWRLYGDDAKGVCLKFAPDKNKLNGAGFFLQKIKYVDGEYESIIKQLKDLVRHVHSLTDYKFVFRTLHKWCHFIKSEDWNVESEIRLLYIVDKCKWQVYDQEWLLANGTNILNPYMDIGLDKFPLKLEEIMLGPKCPDQETNKLQLEELIEEKSMKITVSLSSIKHYR